MVDALFANVANMKKLYVGVRLRRLREERRITQIALAQSLGISPSYLNQLESNHRPLTAPVLLKLSEILGLDVRAFAEGEQARLLADLRDVFADPAGGETIAAAELREIAGAMPAVGREIVALHRRYRHALEKADAMAIQTELSGGGAPSFAALEPFEQVRDFFDAHHNYFDAVDSRAEALNETLRLEPYLAFESLSSYLEREFDVRVALELLDGGKTRRAFDPASRLITISNHLDAGQRAFQLAIQIGLLAASDVIAPLAVKAAAGSATAERLARIGLANHFAAALLMPYRRFLVAAEAEGYDIGRLRHLFGQGFETICHRLASLQRPGAVGVPFFFIRVDRAGNISKRQSAADFHFSRVGGACPLWNVYEAFSQPGRILTQVAQMPDGRTYLWIARTVHHEAGGYAEPGKTFAVGLGCDIRNAPKLVYSKGLGLDDLSAATPIGVGCKMCERPACAQRAFPQIGRPVAVDENRARVAPFAVD
jgi:predicted transcriptional regulator/plasmid maintenance system antidote protein VapI